MYKQLTLFHILESERSRYQNLIRQLTLQREQLPQGYLSYRNGYYYRVVPGRGKRDQIPISQYIPNREQLMNELKERRYISKALPVLKNNLQCCENALAQFQLYDPMEIRRSLPRHYNDFDFSPLLLDGDINPEQWAKAPYKHNTAFPEDLKYRSEGGLATRSKAEADIATKLEQNHFIFRYEPELKLGNHLYYPDFCILHPIYRRLMYWEHFGAMDQPKYTHDSMVKMRVYAEHGYKLGDNFIMTWESEKFPLQFQHINDRISIYLS